MDNPHIDAVPCESPAWAVADAATATDTGRKLEALFPGRVAKVRLGEYGWFFHTRSAFLDSASDGRTLVFKLGTLFEDGKSVSAAALLESGRAAADGSFKLAGLGGGALVLCKDLTGPALTACRTLFSDGEMFCHEGRGYLLCANNFGVMAALLPDAEIDTRALVLHVAFRTVPGHLSFLRGARRLAWGDCMRWDGRDMRTSTLRSAGEWNESDVAFRGGVPLYGGVFETVVRDHLRHAREQGIEPSVMLSGGVDSSLLLAAVSRSSDRPARLRACAHRPNIPSLAPEAEFSSSAAGIIGAEHTFYPMDMKDYLECLDFAVATSGHAAATTQMPFFTRVVQGWGHDSGGSGLLLGGFGADGVNGVPASPKAALAYHVERWPDWMVRAAIGVASLPAPEFTRRLAETRGIAQSGRSADPLSRWPIGRHAHAGRGSLDEFFTAAEIDGALCEVTGFADRCFGRRTIQELTQDYGLVFDSDTTTSMMSHAGRAFGVRVENPYMDLRCVEALSRTRLPDRYARSGMSKPISRELLRRWAGPELAFRSKKNGGFWGEMLGMMKSGLLKDRVRAIERPGFVSPARFKRALEEPDALTFTLLSYDVFRLRVLGRRIAGAR